MADRDVTETFSQRCGCRVNRRPRRSDDRAMSATSPNPDSEILAAIHRARNHAELLTATEALAHRLLEQGVELHDAIDGRERHRKAAERAEAKAARATRERDDAVAERDALATQLQESARVLELFGDELEAAKTEVAELAASVQRLQDDAARVERQRLELSGAYMDLAAFIEHAENVAAEIQRRINGS